MNASFKPAPETCVQCAARAHADAFYARMIIGALCVLVPLAVAAAIF